MGWLFAAALGMQERSSRAVARSLLPIALGHAVSIGAVVLIAALARAVVPLSWIRMAVMVLLASFGLYRLFRSRHPRWGGMQAGFRDLTFWSFLMASAHGAGFMLLPLLLRMNLGTHAHAAVPGTPWTGALAVLVHTLGYLLITGLVAWTVYAKFGLAILRTAWINLDMIWAAALIVSACATLFA